MKVSEFTPRQRKAYFNIKHAANHIIGGLENGLLDNACDSEEYKQYEAELKDHAGLVDTIYSEATTCIYGEGVMHFGKSAEVYMKDIRFCGKEWLLARVEGVVAQLGY